MRRFTMIGYSGGPLSGWAGNVIIDVAGLSLHCEPVPIFRQHDPAAIVGCADRVMMGTRVELAGTVITGTQAGDEVVTLADSGFRWQASVGITVTATEDVKAGQSALVNGRPFAGPGIIIRKASLHETSFVPLGADPATRAVVLAPEDEPSRLAAAMPSDGHRLTIPGR